MNRLRTLYRRLHASTWDLDIVGYLAAGLAAVMLVVCTCVIGPTLDAHDQVRAPTSQSK